MMMMMMMMMMLFTAGRKQCNVLLYAMQLGKYLVSSI